jgi:signal peptide peptidase SppA
MNYPRIAKKLYGEVWAITPEAHHAMQRVFEAHVNGDRSQAIVFPQARFNAAQLTLDPPRSRNSRVYRRGRLAYVPVHGIIGKGLSIMEELCGGYSIDQLNSDIDEVESDPAVSRVLFDFNTPGGQVTGIPETARRIAKMTKETFGYTGDQSDSAGYWLMSQCSYLYCTESSEAGSIGVYMAIYDSSEALKAQGKKLILIRGGKHKGAGLPGNPLTEEEISALQVQVDMIYNSFKGAVSSRRSNVSDETMQGQCFLGRQALDVKLVDAITDSLPSLVARLA